MDIPKNMARALRRHHTERLKRTRATYWGRFTGAASAEALTPRQLGLVATTPHVCSGPCCGNPRKWFNEPRMQERRWAQHSIAELLNTAAND